MVTLVWNYTCDPVQCEMPRVCATSHQPCTRICIMLYWMPLSYFYICFAHIDISLYLEICQFMLFMLCKMIYITTKTYRYITLVEIETIAEFIASPFTDPNVCVVAINGHLFYAEKVNIIFNQNITGVLLFIDMLCKLWHHVYCKINASNVLLKRGQSLLWTMGVNAAGMKIVEQLFIQS